MEELCNQNDFSPVTYTWVCRSSADVQAPAVAAAPPVEPEDRWQMFVSDCPLGNRNTTDSVGHESGVAAAAVTASSIAASTSIAAGAAFNERQILTSLKHSSQNLLVFSEIRLYVSVCMCARLWPRSIWYWPADSLCPDIILSNGGRLWLVRTQL